MSSWCSLTNEGLEIIARSKSDLIGAWHAPFRDQSSWFIVAESRLSPVYLEEGRAAFAREGGFQVNLRISRPGGSAHCRS